MLTLPMDGYGPVTIVAPPSITSTTPVLVALHAHAIRPEHACLRWARAAAGKYLVVCPHGLPSDASPTTAVTLGGAEYTYREIQQGLAEVRRRFGPLENAVAPLLAGWSHGAKIAALMVAEHPDAFGDLIFGEGAYNELRDDVFRAFARKGERRVLMLCSTGPCATTYGAIVKRCLRAGLSCRVESHRGHEHPFDGAAVDLATAAFPWIASERRN